MWDDVLRHLSELSGITPAVMGNLVLTAAVLLVYVGLRLLLSRLLDRRVTDPAIDFAYPTQRFYDNRAEGKPGSGGPV